MRAVWVHTPAMRSKELRLALVCYGGISLAVYMHGVTKEVWKLARASMGEGAGPVEAVYADFLGRMAGASGVWLKVLPDIIAGASAGGMNGVFLAQAIHSGQSLEPLTRVWLERADIDDMLAPDQRGWTSVAKRWAVPLVRAGLARADGAVSDLSPADDVPEAIRAEVRAKLSRLVCSRWLEAPFSGIGLSHVLAGAFDAMAAGECGKPLLPPGHPLDLMTTATDYAGHAESMALHSPQLVEEREHRVSIAFQAPTPEAGGQSLAPLPELVFAVRATSSFPGAFPPLRPSEIDRLMAERGEEWPSRAAFLARLVPPHALAGGIEDLALMDGGVLVNAPFAQAIAALPHRPAETEIDRRLVYIDPNPAPPPGPLRKKPGFLSVVFRAISVIPREQPIRDNLEALARQSAEFARIRSITESIRPDIERQVVAALGAAQLEQAVSAAQLSAWRGAVQAMAAEGAGYAYHAYARLKLEATLDGVAEAMARANGRPEAEMRACVGAWAAGALRLVDAQGQRLSGELVAFLRAHDMAYRIRRLRHVLRGIDACEAPAVAADAARDVVWRALSQMFAKSDGKALGRVFVHAAQRVAHEPATAIQALAADRKLAEIDRRVDALLAEAMAAAPAQLGRAMLLAYLGFAFHDVTSLPLLRGNGLTEMDPVKVDRISPGDVGVGGRRRLKGEEFQNFGAFFSRAYREHDYLLGRLHGAARMADLIASTAEVPEAELAAFKCRLFEAVFDEEESRLRADPRLVPQLRAEFLGGE